MKSIRAGANNPERVLPAAILSLCNGAYTDQVILASFWSTFPAKMQAPSRLPIRVLK